MSKNAEVVKRIEFPFPDDLEGRINAIGNVVNSEIKVATLLRLDDVLVDGSEILRRVRQSVGRGVKLIQARNFSGYCQKSLLPIGCVAEEEFVRDEGEVIEIGHRITEAGKEYGVPLGVFSLQWGVDNSISLYSILGPTSSPAETRPPLIRVNILDLLNEKGILRQVDLNNFLNLPESTSSFNHLRRLQKIGFIDYESLPEKRKGTFKYRFSGKEGELETVVRRPILTKRVLDTIKLFGEIDRHTLAHNLNYECVQNISIALTELERQGFLKRDGKFKVGETLSEAKITDLGRKFVNGYVSVLRDALSDGEALRDLQEEARRFLGDTERFRHYLIKGVQNYRIISPGLNARPIDETINRVIKYLRERPGARPRDLERDLELSCPRKYLTPLVKTGVLEKRQDSENRNAVRYFVR